MTNVNYNFREFCDRSGCDSSEVECIWTELKVPQAWVYDKAEILEGMKR